MQKKIYSIVLYSGLGERKGTLSVEFTENSCEGTIYIMGNENFFIGKFAESGNYTEVLKPAYGIRNMRDTENFMMTV